LFPHLLNEKSAKTSFETFSLDSVIIESVSERNRMPFDTKFGILHRKPSLHSMNCLECNCSILFNVYQFSTRNYGIPLFRDHQDWIDNHKATDYAIALYFALKQRNVPAQLEKYDGHKTIDIAIVEAKVNIEVDGSHHNRDSRQALADLKRTLFSFKKGYFTLRIPNSLIRHDLIDNIADDIVELLVIGRKKATKDRSSLFRRHKT
jgi:very-short-patch-repair endonuclease